jgi:hypothetical protein
MADKRPKAVDTALKSISDKNIDIQKVQDGLVTVFAWLFLKYEKKLQKTGKLDKIKSTLIEYFGLDATTDKVKKWYKNGAAVDMLRLAQNNYDINDADAIKKLINLKNLFQSDFSKKDCDPVNHALNKLNNVLNPETRSTGGSKSMTASWEERTSSDSGPFPAGFGKTKGSEGDEKIFKGELEACADSFMDALDAAVGKTPATWMNIVIDTCTKLLACLNSIAAVGRLAEYKNYTIFNGTATAFTTEISAKSTILGSEFYKLFALTRIWGPLWVKLVNKSGDLNDKYVKTFVNDQKKILRSISKNTSKSVNDFAKKSGRGPVAVSGCDEIILFPDPTGTTVYDFAVSCSVLSGCNVVFTDNHGAAGKDKGNKLYKLDNNHLTEDKDGGKLCLLKKGIPVEIVPGNSVFTDPAMTKKHVVTRIGADCFGQGGPFENLGNRKVEKRFSSKSRQ